MIDREERIEEIINTNLGKNCTYENVVHLSIIYLVNLIVDLEIKVEQLENEI